MQEWMEKKMNMRRREFLGLSAATLAASGTGVRSAWAQDSAAGSISRLTGTATILRLAGTVPAAIGAEVGETDRIRTGVDSRAEVTFSDGSVLTVGPESEVAIATFAPAAGESNAVLDLIAGIVRVTVNKATNWGRFDVRTTTAVASVRGTDYLVEEAGGKSAVFVAEGRVAVSSRVGAGTIVIGAGQGVDVTAEYVPLVAKFWGAKRRDTALARVTFP